MPGSWNNPLVYYMECTVKASSHRADDVIVDLSDTTGNGAYEKEFIQQDSKRDFPIHIA